MDKEEFQKKYDNSVLVCCTENSIKKVFNICDLMDLTASKSKQITSILIGEQTAKSPLFHVEQFLNDFYNEIEGREEKKREKEFKEYLKNKFIDFAPCIEAYEDYNLRITEVLDALEELRMSYQASSNVVDGNIESMVIQISSWEDNFEIIGYDTFVEKYREYDKEYEPEHYIKDENGNMVHVELVSVKAGKNMIITWKDTETGKMFQTIE